MNTNTQAETASMEPIEPIAEISVALCVYNGEKYLQEQLDSLAAQTRLPDEVVVGDDRSCDRTLEMVRQWARTVPFPVRITVNEKNLGYARNFESVLLRCKGKIIFLADQDDVWLPDKIAVMARRFQQSPSVQAVFCNAELVDQGGQSMNLDLVSYTRPWQYCREPAYLGLDAREEIAIYGCAIAVRKSLVEQIFPMPPNPKWGHDVWIYVMARHFGEIVIETKPLFLYRVHGNNVSTFLYPWQQAIWESWYYREGPYLNRLYEQKRQELIERLQDLPDSDRKRRHLRYLLLQRRHGGARRKIQERIITGLPLALAELVAGRYHQFPQPWKSLLYDLKEGFLNLWRKT